MCLSMGAFFVIYAVQFRFNFVQCRSNFVYFRPNFVEFQFRQISFSFHLIPTNFVRFRLVSFTFVKCLNITNLSEIERHWTKSHEKTRISRQDWLITRELCVHSIGGGSGRMLLTFVFHDQQISLSENDLPEWIVTRKTCRLCFMNTNDYAVENLILFWCLVMIPRFCSDK